MPRKSKGSEYSWRPEDSEFYRAGIQEVQVISGSDDPWSPKGPSVQKAHGLWEVLTLVDSEAAARVSGAAETVDYFW